MEQIVDKSIWGSSNGDNDRPTFDTYKELYNLRCLYKDNSPAQKASDSIGNTPHWYFLPLVKKMVLLVLFLSNLMYYVRK